MPLNFRSAFAYADRSSPMQSCEKLTTQSGIDGERWTGGRTEGQADGRRQYKAGKAGRTVPNAAAAAETTASASAIEASFPAAATRRQCPAAPACGDRRHQSNSGPGRMRSAPEGSSRLTSCRSSSFPPTVCPENSRSQRLRPVGARKPAQRKPQTSAGVPFCCWSCDAERRKLVRSLVRSCSQRDRYYGSQHTVATYLHSMSELCFCLSTDRPRRRP